MCGSSYLSGKLVGLLSFRIVIKLRVQMNIGIASAESSLPLRGFVLKSGYCHRQKRYHFRSYLRRVVPHESRLSGGVEPLFCLSIDFPNAAIGLNKGSASSLVLLKIMFTTPESFSASV